MAKGIGRNAACPCGSGNKYKRCCGSSLHGEMLERARHDAVQSAGLLHFQRERQQGKGRPIVAAKQGEYWSVAVGRRIFRGHWKTFTDFLFDYIRGVVGMAWGQAEIHKPEVEKHPIIRWYQKLCLLQAEYIKVPGQIASMPMQGVVVAYLGLSYDLYTLEHNEESTPSPGIRERLLNRLRHPDQFAGARYEIRVAAMFLRAGFRLEWEDETDGTTTHGEFLAVFPETGRKFWIECKIRQREAGATTERLGKFVGLVSSALQKKAEQERFIFVDLNTPAQERLSKDSSDWRDWAVGRLRMLEGSPAGRDLPSALIMVTNFPEQYHLDTNVPDAGGAIEGFKREDYRLGVPMTLSEAINKREKNMEVESFLQSMMEHQDLPSTFDGSIPGLDGNVDRLVIGRSYELDEAVSGVLVDACVVEDQKKAMAVFRRSDGTQAITFVPMSDSEIQAWKRYPETFFGVMRDPQKGISNALELYDFFLRSYRESSKETLLEQISQGHDVSAIKDLTQEEIAKFWAERTTEAAAHHAGGFPIPQWAARLRPPPQS